MISKHHNHTQQKRRWYAEKRAELLTSLGGKCERCGNSETLTVEHKRGREWSLQKVNRAQRMRIYLREHADKKLGCLCNLCNVFFRNRKDMQKLFWDAMDSCGGIPF